MHVRNVLVRRLIGIDEIDAAIAEVMASGWFVGGPVCTRF